MFGAVLLAVALATVNPIVVENQKPGSVMPPTVPPATANINGWADANVHEVTQQEVDEYLRAVALASGEMVELDGELVDNTLDVWAWRRVASCESTGRWFLAPRSSSGPSGYVQILSDTWRRYGGEEFAPLAYLATPSEQLEVARRILDGGGWSQWSCARRVGLR